MDIDEYLNEVGFTGNKDVCDENSQPQLIIDENCDSNMSTKEVPVEQGK